MTDPECTCAARRPLGADHLSSCPMWEFADIDSPGDHSNVVQVFRNASGRPIAVPDAIVTEAEREYAAYKDHVASKDWNTIATIHGYPSGQAASAAVRRYLDEGRAVVGDFRREEVVATEVGRLNALREALWTGAMMGKVPNVMAVLAIHDRWVKLFGVDTPQAAQADLQTVVVPSEDYLADLRRQAAPRAVSDAG